jgi:hypothetical protein
MYDVTRPDAPIWSTRQEPLAIPDGYADRLEIKLDAGFTLVADIFDAVPGKEVVTSQGLWPYSPVCIRIFDLSGRLLYSVWHDGGVTDMLWAQHRRQIVVAGLASETRWDERGLDWPGAPYPFVVFTIEPQLGHIADPWIVEHDRVRDPTVRWYKWLGPVDQIGALGTFELRIASRSTATGEELLVARAHMWKSSAEMMFGLDETGTEITRWTSDVYKAGVLAGELPDPDVYRLFDINQLPARLDADP